MGNSSSQLSPSMLESADGARKELLSDDVYALHSRSDNVHAGSIETCIDNKVTRNVDRTNRQAIDSPPENAEMKNADNIVGESSIKKSTVGSAEIVDFNAASKQQAEKSTEQYDANAEDSPCIDHNSSTLNTNSPSNSNHISDINRLIRERTPTDSKNTVEHPDLTQNLVDIHKSTQGSFVPNSSEMMLHVPPTFKGTFLEDGSSTYGAKILHNEKEYYLGSYQLLADAAHSYDVAASFLKGQFSERNFQTEIDWFGARMREMPLRGIAISFSESLDAVDERINYYLQYVLSDVNDVSGQDDTKTDGCSVQEVGAKDIHAQEKDTIEPKESSPDAALVSDRNKNTSPSSNDDEDNIASSTGEESTTAPAVRGELSATQSLGYKGVFKSNSKFSAKIYLSDNKQRYMGTYCLQADAARAYDKGAEEFKMSSRTIGRLRNFETEKEYEAARKRELETSGVSTQRAGSIAQIEEQIQQRILEIRDPTIKQQTSLYKGVSKSTGSSKYHAVIYHNKKQNNLGKYVLECDGALARDTATKRLKSHEKTFNFHTREQYLEAREKELVEKGIDVEHAGTVNAIGRKIKSRVEKISTMSVEPALDVSPASNQEDSTELDQTSIDEQVDHQATSTTTTIQPTNLTKQKSSTYKGVYKLKGRSKYGSRIRHNKKQHSLGCHILESDGAWSYDKAAFRLKGKSWTFNFKSKRRYLEAREHELAEKGINADQVDSVDTLNRFIKTQVDKILEESETIQQSVKEASPSIAAPVFTEGNANQSPTHKRKQNGELKSKKNKDTDDPMAKTDALAEKWGPMFVDNDWQRPDYLTVHQRGISSLLLNLRDTQHQLEGVSNSSGTNEVKSSDAEKRKIAELDSSAAESCASETKILEACATDNAILQAKQDKASMQHESTEQLRGHQTPVSKQSATASATNHIESGAPIVQKRAVSLSPQMDIDTQSNDEQCLAFSSPEKKRAQILNDQSTSHAEAENMIVPTAEEVSTGTNEAKTPTSEARLETEDASAHSQSAADETKNSRNVIESELILLLPGQTSHLPFPVGCKVWWGFQSDAKGELFNLGIVHNVHFNFSSRVMVYEVVSADDAQSSKESNRNLLFEEDLAYAPGLQVYYSPSGLIDDDASGERGEVLYCRTTSSNDGMNFAKELSVAVQNELTCLKSKNSDAECINRVRALLHKLDTEVMINRSILKETGIGRTIKSISKVLAKADNETASNATQLIEKWKSQIARPQIYYSLLVFGDNNEIQLAENVPRTHIKIMN